MDDKDILWMAIGKTAVIAIVLFIIVLNLRASFLIIQNF